MDTGLLTLAPLAPATITIYRRSAMPSSSGVPCAAGHRACVRAGEIQLHRSAGWPSPEGGPEAAA